MGKRVLIVNQRNVKATSTILWRFINYFNLVVIEIRPIFAPLPNFTMAQTLISLYPHIKDSRNGVDITIETFLNRIQTGFWQDAIIPARLALSKTADKEERAAIKAPLPYVTISGVFSIRKNDGLKEHSGILAIDIDDEDPEAIKAKLRKDRHVYAIFASCSGTGACVLFRIHPLKHLASFEAIAEYLYRNYQIIVDQNCKDVSRPRYVSYDPTIYIEANAQEFKEFSKAKPGPKKEAKEKPVVFIQNEFDGIIAEIENRGTDLAPTYHEWLKVAYSLADKFGEAGREYFHRISRIGTTYTEKAADRQYTACINNLKDTAKPVTIASLYYLCKTAGIPTASETVANITRRAATHRKAHSTSQQSINNIISFPDFPADQTLVEEIVKQVYEKEVYVEDISEIESGRIWIRNAGLRRNEITGQLHLTETALTSSQIEGIELRMREDMDDMDKSNINLLLKSDSVPLFNEIKDFFAKYREIKGTGAIAALAKSLNSPTGAGTDYVERMLRKWIVGGISCAIAEESHTMLCLCGEQHGDGKSYFFKKFLPPELAHLTACKDLSGLNNESNKKDFDILITQAWLIYDDEMGNKNKRDHDLIKAKLAQSYTDVRAAYARTSEHRKRIAFFGGTSNDLGVIPDHGENRRILPVQIMPGGIDQAAKDRIDPVDYIMEAYHLLKSGYDYRILNDEITFLNQHTEIFREHTFENELVSKRFRAASPNCGEYLTGTDIKLVLEENMKDRINVKKIKAAMKAIGAPQETRIVNGIHGRYYYVCRQTFTEIPYEAPQPDEDPF